MKAFYTKEVTGWGYAPLRRWQHVKRPVWNRLFSAVSVQGYMGPFFAESQVNRDVSKAEYPYVVAHEMAHLAGVTSEAEASFWGFEYCRGSGNGAVRYSGYLSLLPFVLQQANYLLPEEDFAAFCERIPEKARESIGKSAFLKCSATSSPTWKLSGPMDGPSKIRILRENLARKLNYLCSVS